MNEVAGWGHPLVGVIAVALVLRAASHAMRLRRGGVGAAAARGRHRALAPRALAAVALAWLTGLAGVWAFHHEIEPAASGHFRAGSAVVALLALNAVLSRRLRGDPVARAVHPWVGAAAVLLAGLQVFLGLQLLRR